MNTNTGFTEVTEDDVTQALKKVLLPRLREALEASHPGHCMRATNLDLNLMTALCSDLRRTCPDSQVFILRNDKTISNTSDPGMYITSTKLVEQRNPLPNGEQRPPLVVFIPTDLRTSAEDSFGVATFADIPVGDAYDKQLEQLHEQEVPSLLQGAVQEIFSILTHEQWPWADVVTQVRYLLTATKNQVDGETLGASLYELGLIPDFHLLDDPSLLTVKIRRNLEAVRNITYSSASTRGRVLELGLTDKNLQRRLLDFFSQVGVDDPSSWTRLIVLQRNNRDLSFDKWTFVDDIIHDKISIEVLPLNIPIAGEDDEDENLSGLSGQKVLNPNNQNKLQVTFRVDPLPFQVASLEYFTVQILTRNGEPVGSTKRIKAWKSKKPDQIVNLDKLNKIEWNDGWHVVRVLAWTKDELPVPLDHRYVQGSDPRTRRNESEPFYVLQQGEIEDEAPRTPPQEYSLEHAKLRLQFKALSEERPPEDVMPEVQLWTKKTNKTSRSKQVHLETLEVKFTHGERYRIYISRSLKEFEQKILSQPENPASWSWHIKTNTTAIAAPILEHVDWPKSAAMENFLDARRGYVEAVQAQVADKEGITQTADLQTLLDPCITYADAYRDLLTDLRYKIQHNGGIDQQKAIRILRSVLAIDSIHVVLTDFRGCIREATLIAPTHPLRALWHANWAQIAQYWLHSTQQLLKANLSSVQENILRKLVPLNIPPTLPCTDGRVFTMIDMLNPFWSLYAPATEEDTRGLLSQMCNILGLPEPAIGGETITAEVLAARMSRYIVQHPYIRTLKINTFNPGSATVLADALVQLQKQDPFSQLRYDIHLFVPDTTVPRIGEALELLLSPVSTANTEAVDAFSIPGNSHLFPKLSLAIHDTQNFITTPHKYRAHLSVLFDLFPAQEIGASPPLQPSDTAPLYGLVQDFRSDFQDTRERTFWRRQPRHGEPQTLPNLEHSIDLLAALSHSLSGAISTVATGLPAFEQRPTFMIGLDMQQRELIHHIHEISDWVLTIDRNIGIEFFDHGRTTQRPDYLIDFIPNNSAGFGHQLIITSRALLELEATLRLILEKYHLKAGRRETSLVLSQLRSLSGRLALKLISSPNQQGEALGLALARLFLINQGALQNQIILPLDAHLYLINERRKLVEELGDDVTLRRTDLALFDLNASKRTIRCNLIEVKCHNQVGGLEAYNKLKTHIIEQIVESEGTLNYHFNPHRQEGDRPDRLLKTHEFTHLLDFYLDRSRRYKLITLEAYQEARYLLTTLEEGYTLEFTHSALIFDFSHTGTDSPETEFDVAFYRIGKDLINTLISEAEITTQANLDREEAEENEDRPISQSHSSSIPRLASAPFIVPPREHSVSWEPQKESSHISVSQPEASPRLLSKHDSQDVYAGIQQENIPLSENHEADLTTEYKTNHDEEHSALPTGKIKIAERINAPYNIPANLPPLHDIVLGVQGTTPQYGILGETAGRKIALDLNQTHTISLFGVQGSGKSYTLGSIIEMACLPIPHINALPSPLATVVFHYSPTQDYKPEFTSLSYPNSDQNQIKQLQEQYGAEPSSLKDIVLLVPSAKIEERKAEYPDIEVHSIAFAASELKASHWKFLMGAVGSQSAYMRQINHIMRKLRDKLTLEALQQEIAASTLSEHLKGLAQMRLAFAAEYIDDSQNLRDIIHPGRLIIVDLRDEFIDKDEALGLFVVLLQIFSEATFQGKPFNKLVVFDEAHKYIENDDLIAGLIEVVREMRHKGTSILVASQDPPSVSTSLIELSSQIILHKFNSPSWLKHIQKANAALNGLSPEQLSHLGPGEAFFWSSKATDEAFTKRAIKVKGRPRVTLHGGNTKTAVVN